MPWHEILKNTQVSPVWCCVTVIINFLVDTTDVVFLLKQKPSTFSPHYHVIFLLLKIILPLIEIWFFFSLHVCACQCPLISLSPCCWLFATTISAVRFKNISRGMFMILVFHLCLQKNRYPTYSIRNCDPNRYFIFLSAGFFTYMSSVNYSKK